MKVRSNLPNILFVLAVVVFTIVQLSVFLVSSSQRSDIFNSDDSYIHILKAPQLERCFLQDCLALEGIQEQLQGTQETYEVVYENYEMEKVFFLVWHPLHSLILIFLHAVGLSWELAYQIVFVLGGVLLGGAVGYLLMTIFGRTPASLTLLVSAFYIFPGYGFHNAVPNTMALGLGMLAWGLVLAQAKNYYRYIVVLILLMVLLHPVGRIYGLLTVLLFVAQYFLNGNKRLSSKEGVVIFAGIAFVVIPFLLPYFIARPKLDIVTSPVPPGWGGFNYVLINAEQAVQEIKNWIGSFGFLPSFFSSISWLPFVVLFVWGVLQLPRETRKKLMLSTFTLGIFLAGTSIVLVPNYPAYTFIRMWPALAVVFLGVIVYGVYRSFLLLQKSPLFFRSESIDSSKWRLSALRPELFAILVLFFAVGAFYNYISIGLRNLKWTTNEFIHETRYNLSPSHVEDLLAFSSQEDGVVFFSRYLATNYLTNGLWDRKILVITKNSDKVTELQDFSSDHRNTFFVSFNPLGRLQRKYVPWETNEFIVYEGGLHLKQGQEIDIYSSDRLHLSSLYLYLVTNDEEADLRIQFDPDAGKDAIDFTVPPNYEGWYRLEEENVTSSYITIEALNDNPKVEVSIKGIRYGTLGDLYWPWDQGISLGYDFSNDDMDTIEIEFLTTNLLPGNDFQVQILDDYGSTILAEIIP